MRGGETGYLHSAYSSDAMFPVLTEVFGFDVAAYLFPGIWESKAEEDFHPLDGVELDRKVNFLVETAATALEQEQYTLPWVREFAAVTGAPAPDHDLCQTEVKATCEMLGRMMGAGAKTRERAFRMSLPLSASLIYYLRDLLNFANLAKTLNESGKATSLSRQ